MSAEKALFYEGPYYMFSNFSSFALEWRGCLWPTSEHAYQAAKFEDSGVSSKIRTALSAHDAKKIAHANADKVRRNWDEIKMDIMEDILRNKLGQNPYIQQKLLETGDMEIVEDSPKDSFWGRGPDWNGENNLGKLWMKLRKELRQ